jgi:hypothetical protein
MAQFTPLLMPKAADIRSYRNNLHPDAPIRLGVISNPFSRTNARTRMHDRLLPRFLADRQDAIDTRTLDDLDQALLTLIFERRCNVLGLNGGDGTLHSGVNRLLALSNKLMHQTGESLPLPHLLFLNGGTLNIVSRATGTKGNPARTVRTFAKLTTGRLLGQLQTRELGLLKVDADEQPTRYGFIFGSEVVANALEMYALFGEGYTGLMRFMAELFAGYALNTRLWQEHGWKLDAPHSSVEVDKLVFARYTCAVAATIDLSILKGVITALRVPEGASGFFAKVLLTLDKRQILRLIPRLMIGTATPGVRDIPAAQSLKLRGSYALDGECFIDRRPSASQSLMTVSRAPFNLRAVRLH